MIKTRRQLSLLALAALAASPASAQLGGLLGGAKGGGSSGNVDVEVKNFLGKSMRIESTLNKAAVAIVAAYASEKDRAKLQASLDELGKQTDPKEAGAKFQEVSESTSAELKKLAASSDLTDRTKGLSEARQQQLLKGIGNFLLGALQAKDLAPTGQNVLSAAGANPMNLGKVLPVKDALPRLANAGTLAAQTIPQFVKVLQGANIKVPEVTTASKEESIDQLV